MPEALALLLPFLVIPHCRHPQPSLASGAREATVDNGIGLSW